MVIDLTPCTFAEMAKRLIGEAAQAVQLELALMSNNIKCRKTISVMTLATRVIERPDLMRKMGDVWRHMETLRGKANAASACARRAV